MTNPLDKAFFRFLIGFGLILSMSFALLFFVGKYSSALNDKEAGWSVNSALTSGNNKMNINTNDFIWTPNMLLLDSDT